MPAKRSTLKLTASPPTIPAASARRLLLGAQGLLGDSMRRVNAAVLSNLIEDMGFVQIDTINVIERAHHLTLFSRLDHYRHGLLATLLEEKRDLFEHWTHDASVIPTKWFPHWRHRFDRYSKRIRTNAWWKERIGSKPDQLIAAVKERIMRDGPLLSRDFEHERSGKKPPEEGWWGWKPQKAALEHLWRCGELAVAKRINFQKVYDLTERVFPDHHSQPAPELDEHVDWACRTAMDRLGVASPSEIAGFWHAIDLAQARRWCAAAMKRGEIIAVNVESADGSKPRPAFAPADWEIRLKKTPTIESIGKRVRLLSPFDPVLRDRQRTKRLFNFDYTFEAFTPAPKRKYGYFVLPLMQGERMIGRLDPKLHRDRGELEVKGLWMEPKVKMTKALRRRIEAEVQRLAEFTGARSVKLPNPMWIRSESKNTTPRRSPGRC